ncbi:MAG: enamine deaminase RidA [Rhodospirillaceae bacterium]|nr:enamine deaminase RidA [Rhodospirillaceae bacterium]|tara:strand:- start:247 stop:648 length:402 start_codon:yes stop_codon:yes gene_type:complete
MGGNMPTRFFDPKNVSTRSIPYSHGVQVEASSTLLFMSGQVGRGLPHGEILPDFEGQIRQTYANIESVLKDANMTLTNLVKITTYLTDRSNLEAMREIRKEILGDHKPAHTLVIVAGLAFEEYLIEVDCVAAI